MPFDTWLNSLPNQISDKLKAIQDCKIDGGLKIEVWCGGKVRKQNGKRRKCWLPAFSLYTIMFSKESTSRTSTVVFLCQVNSSPNNKFLDWSKLKAFADDQTRNF